ncbi:MAG TPA: SDR family NAD(P)-dependent oxidoreductase [Myxococcota bacterium]
MALSDDDKHAALRVLEAIAGDRSNLAGFDEEERKRIQKAAGEIARPDLAQRKRLQRELLRNEIAQKKARDDDKRKSTGIRELRARPVFTAPPPSSLLGAGSDLDEDDARADDETVQLEDARKCYVCKREYTALHPFYDQLCLECGGLNFKKRTQHADLTGRVALLTGARVKIGFQAALLLLRAGATVVACTRFPQDAARRYASEPDYAQWAGRLRVTGIDLRHTPSVEVLCHHLAHTLPRLDIQIHNACQTVRRPPGFYGHLLDGERADLPKELAGAVLRVDGVRDPVSASQLALEPKELASNTAGIELFPKGVLDADLQQVDLRTHNSWRLTLGDVPTLELLEVLLVNAAAPFVMAAKLKPLMLASPPLPDPAKHIVMVSAMEGQFYRGHKTDKHPHTNMGKAALNMLVRTSAQDYKNDQIHLNAVDTGWVTDEDPAHIAARKAEEHRFSPPLDIIDGAARIVDPVLDGYASGRHVHGRFLKDYAPTPW